MFILLYFCNEQQVVYGVKCGSVVLLGKTDHLLFSNRSYAYASLDRFDEALDDAENVVRLRPDWPKGYFRKGAALYGLGRYEDAVIAFMQCLALDKDVSSAKEFLSKVNSIIMYIK